MINKTEDLEGLLDLLWKPELAKGQALIKCLSQKTNIVYLHKSEVRFDHRSQSEGVQSSGSLSSRSLLSETLRPRNHRWSVSDQYTSNQ